MALPPHYFKINGWADYLSVQSIIFKLWGGSAVYTDCMRKRTLKGISIYTWSVLNIYSVFIVTSPSVLWFQSQFSAPPSFHCPHPPCQNFQHHPTIHPHHPTPYPNTTPKTTTEIFLGSRLAGSLISQVPITIFHTLARNQANVKAGTGLILIHPPSGLQNWEWYKKLLSKNVYH